MQERIGRYGADLIQHEGRALIRHITQEQIGRVDSGNRIPGCSYAAFIGSINTEVLPAPNIAEHTIRQSTLSMEVKKISGKSLGFERSPIVTLKPETREPCGAADGGSENRVRDIPSPNIRGREMEELVVPRHVADPDCSKPPETYDGLVPCELLIELPRRLRQQMCHEPN
jgi:hypothetical protein